MRLITAAAGIFLITAACTQSDPRLESDVEVPVSVEDIAHATYTYQPAANADLDGDSDGTSITLNKP